MNPFLEPPDDIITISARHPELPLIMSAVFLVGSLVFGVLYTIRRRSPLYFACALAGFTLYPLLIEPMGDWIIALWYPTNFEIAAVVFDRPIPLFAVLFYGAGIPLVAVFAYETVKLGLPARYMIGLVAIVTILELPAEIGGSQLNWMNYFGNPAVLGGVPIYCFVQNGGMFAVVGWMLGWVMPHIRSWRWVLVPFAAAVPLPAMAALGTFPAYIAIATQASPGVIWAAAILSTLMNAAIVLACIYSPTLQRYREEAATRHSSMGDAGQRDEVHAGEPGGIGVGSEGTSK